MASEGIMAFGHRHRDLFAGPVLEVGSKWQEGYEQFSPRDFHPGSSDYVGIDIEAGDGVDRVLDISRDDEVAQLPAGHFRTIHCHCVLEHVPNVFAMCRNMERLLAVGGVLFVSVPFVWRIHRIPVDMWRFTPQSLDYLFPSVSFDAQRCGFSTRHPSACYPIDRVPELALGSSLSDRGLLFATTVRVLRRLGLDQGIFNTRALMQECNLMMIGTKGERPAYSFLDSKHGDAHA